MRTISCGFNARSFPMRTISCSMRAVLFLLLSCFHLTPGDGLSALELAPDVSSVKITSGGSNLIARHFTPRLPRAAAKAPAVLLLHGIPGTEQNWDVAYALRDAGFHCLLFHYRGCWGSEGNYSITGVPEDISNALQWLLAQESIDTDKIVVCGHSMGGYHALRLATESARQACVPPPFEKLPGTPPRVRGVVAICPLATSEEPLPEPYAVEFAKFLNNISPQEILEQIGGLKSVGSMAERVPEPADPKDKLPLLVITGDADPLFSPRYYQAHLWPVLKGCAGVAPRFVRMEHGDHALCRYRRQLVSEVVRFCRKSVGGWRGASSWGEKAMRGREWVEEMARDFVPLMVLVAAVSGWVAGRWDATPAGRAKLRREEVQKRDTAKTLLDEPPVGGRG